MANYNLPELRDSPFSQLLATLPSLLMRIKENQTAQSNKDRQFQAQQQQQARQQFESDRAFNDANEDQIRQEKIKAKEGKLKVFTDLLSSEDDPSTKASYLRMMGKADPDNMGNFSALAAIQDTKGTERELEEDLVKQYAAGSIDSATFYGEIETPWAIEQGFDIERNNGLKTYSYQGDVVIFNPKTGKRKTMRIGGDPNLQFYKDNYKEIAKTLREGYITKEEKATLESGEKFYGSKLEELGVDIFKGNPLDLTQ